MKILILGGTGAMGRYLIPLLEERQHEVFVTSRSTHQDKDSVHYLQGDAHDITFRKKCLKVHYHAIIDFLIYEEYEFKEVAKEYLSVTDQYIFISSARVYADSAEPIAEDSGRLLDVCKDENYLATKEYALKKAREENWLLHSSMKNWTIIRPYITYSSERLQLGVFEKEAWLYRTLQGKKIVFAKDIAKHLTTMTYGKDVALAMCGLIGNQKALGSIFHIAGAAAIHWRDVLKIYCSVLEKKLGRSIEVHMMKNSLSLAKIMGNHYQIIYDRMYDRVFDNRKIEEVGENVIYTSPEDGLSQCLMEFLDNGSHMKNINILAEAYMDKLTGEHMQINKLIGWKKKLKYLIARYTPYLNWKYKL